MFARSCTFIFIFWALLARGDWQLVNVPGAWETNGPANARNYDGFAWYRAWLKPHESFYTPHERNLFAESVTLTMRGVADAHEVFVNGKRIGGGGSFPPNFSTGREGNHRHKIPPGLLSRGEWNEVAVRIYNASGPGGFLSEAPFVMDYFNECLMEGEWEWQAGDNPSWPGGSLKEKPARAAFDKYRESSGVLGEAAQFVHGPKLPPEESLQKLKPAEDLVVEQLLHEPLIAQPTHLSYDTKGRLWVAQYRQYPYPAGLKMLNRDKYYRAHYDKVPPAPPNHDKGRDIISIHEDTDRDGKYDKHKIFVEGLNMANAVLPGKEGVWVMHTPYLVFFPDKNGDDIPDGLPEVHLSGFGLEDTHSVANGLVWGPDGWIYGGQGSTTSSRVIRPGLDKEGVYFEGCMIWRYHPGTKTYEIFAEGSGNVFGLELDGEGRLFSGHNGAETRGWHYMQGGYYMKQGVDPGKFGPPRNPYAFGELPWMKLAAPIQRFTHMLSVVEGTAFPANRQGQMFWVDPIHSLVIATERQTRGSTFGTRDLGNVLTSSDEGFRPVFIVNAPDGSMHIADFYEFYIAHGQHYQSQIDPTTGRIYRLKGKDSSLEKDYDLTTKSIDELVALLTHSNKWHRQTAARLLGWKATPEVLAKCKALLIKPDAPVGALWALHLGGGLDNSATLQLIKHPSPLIREWTVRLAGDTKRVSSEAAVALQSQARLETDIRVRAQMASTARRLPPNQAFDVVSSLSAHDEDTHDPCIPLLCWWVLETNIPAETETILALLNEQKLWERPLIQQHILPPLMRRYAVEGKRADLLLCARLLKAAPNQESKAQLLKGFEEAYRGRAMTGLPQELLAELGEKAPIAMRLRQGDANAAKEALLIAENSKARLEDRILYIKTLSEIKEPKAPAVFLKLALSSEPVALRSTALNALANYTNDECTTAVVAALPKMPREVRQSAFAMLTTRPEWSILLLNSRNELPPDIADRLRNSKDAQVKELAARLLAKKTLSQTAQQEMAKIEGILKQGPGNPYQGEVIYTERCASCHKLWFKGGNVGPDLTAYQRDNLSTLLQSVILPNSEIREGYSYVEIETTDGRNLGGFLTDRDNQVVVIRGLDGHDVTLQLSEVKSLEPTGRSLMPEGLLEGLSDTQLRDFFAYLRQSQPFTR